LPPWHLRANIETVERVGVANRLARLDESMAVALFVAAGTGSRLVATVASTRWRRR